MTDPPGGNGRSIRTLEWTGDALRLLNQRVLPLRESVTSITQAEGVAHAIQTMVVRGAPAIGVAAAFGLVLAVRNAIRKRLPWREEFRKAALQLRATRPTAVNLFWAIERMRKAAEKLPDEPEGAAYHLEKEAMAIYDEDVAANRRMGANGAKLLKSGSVITHCNAGALATAGYGTALGVVRAAVAAGKKMHVYVGETRPVLQGARLTAWELGKDGIPCTVMTDSMAATILQAGKAQAAIVGADRIAANGDVANKIGTYKLGVLAKENGIPFYAVVPTSTIDLSVPTGDDIPIEERDDAEVTHVRECQVAPDGVRVLNLAFDVTPHRYVTGIVTENGIAYPPYKQTLRQMVGG